MTDPTPTPSAPELDPAPPSPGTPEPAKLLDTAPPAEDPPVATPADWPEDWRQKYAKGDEKVLKRLERYGSPQAALDALFAAQNKISSGALKSALKPDATPEEVAAWRADNGIPESPEGYEVQLPNGIVLGESDKPVVDEFLKAAHEANMHPDQVNKALAWYMDKQERAQAEQVARDEEARIAAEDELRQEFGSDYRRNLQIAKNLLDSAPEGLADKILGGRTAEGTPLGNDPDVIRWLVGLSRELNPIATVVPGSGTNAIQAVESEIATLTAMMGDHSSEYWKGPNAQRNQERYRELVSARDRTRARAA